MTSILIAFSIVPFAHSQSLDYPRHMLFKNILDGKDIGLGEAEAIITDHEGFMWFGGRNQLVRYDGKSFVNIRTEVIGSDGETRLSDSIQNVTLFEDRDKTLWVGSRNGLRRYDRDREVLEKMDSEILRLTGFANISATALKQAPDGTIYFTSYEGLFSIQPDGSEIKQVGASGEGQGLLYQEMMDILIRENTAWLATLRGIVALELDTKKATLFAPDPNNPDSRHINYIQALEFDRHGTLWAGVGKGVYAFNTHTKTYKLYEGYSASTNLSGGIIRDIHLDKFGMLWIASDSQGLSLFDENADQFIRFEHVTGDSTTLNSNTLRAIAEDHKGDLWIGGYPTGINYYDRSSDVIRILQHTPGNAQTIAYSSGELLLEDKDEKLWIGTKAGLTVYDRRNQTYSHYTEGNGKSPTNGVISGLIDSDGDIWIGTWAFGLLKYDPNLDKLVQIPFDENATKTESVTAPRLNDAYVWSIDEDKEKNLWVATHNGAVSKFDKKSGNFTNYLAGDDGVEYFISAALVWTTLEDSQGRFWVGTAGGLTLLDRDTATSKRYYSNADDPGSLVNISILSIHEDKKNRLWFGTDGGLHLYQEETDSFKVYTTDNGFLDHGIRAIVEDKHGNLWLGTNKGIVKFNPDTKEVENFSTFNGRPIGVIDTNVGLISQRGELMFGTNNGVFIYNIENIEKNKTVPPVVLTKLNLFTNSISVHDGSGLLEKALGQTKNITFDYTQNMFSIEFAALNFRQPENNQYAYKMIGFDKEWREVGNKNVAVYTNLSPGEYTFRVKASNNDGLWNEQGNSIKIVQLPPPWLTWWAKFIYALGVISIVAWYIYVQYRKRARMEKQNRLLESKVAERTAELKSKTDDIRAMLSNITQGLFTIQIDGTIHKEYSKYLETIFVTDHIAGSKASEFLFDAVDGSKNLVSQADRAMGVILGEDQMNFDFNSHLLISEYKKNINGAEKNLELDWSPILSDKVVDKLMVSVRDVTDLRVMRQESEDKRREIDIISQLIEIPETKFRHFFEGSQRYLISCRNTLMSCASPDDAVLALLFRNMHTIKGNSRTFGFDFLSDVVHEAEKMYVKDGEQKNDISCSHLLDGVEKVERQLEEYQNVYHSIFGKRLGLRNYMIPFESLSMTLKEGLNSFLREHPEHAKDKNIKSVYSAINKECSMGLKEILSDVEKSLSSIAKQLDKHVPEVTVSEGGVRIGSEYLDMIRDVFTHIIRNCIDHGIETPEERLAIGKPASGRINIKTERQEKFIVFSVSDDGRGLDLENLFNKGVKLGKWKVEDEPTAISVANLIFYSGVTTKDHITDISGRGVGLDAARQFLSDCGGKIELVLGDGSALDQKAPMSFQAFKLIVSVPISFCFTFD